MMLEMAVIHRFHARRTYHVRAATPEAWSVLCMREHMCVYISLTHTHVRTSLYLGSYVKLKAKEVLSPEDVLLETYESWKLWRWGRTCFLGQSSYNMLLFKPSWSQDHFSN